MADKGVSVDTPLFQCVYKHTSDIILNQLENEQKEAG